MEGTSRYTFFGGSMEKLLSLPAVLFFILIIISGCGPAVNTPPVAPIIHEQTTSVEATYVDGDGSQLLTRYDTLHHEVTLVWANQPVTLPGVVSASGAKYSNRTLLFWNKGDNALYKRDGTVLFEGVEQARSIGVVPRTEAYEKL